MALIRLHPPKEKIAEGLRAREGEDYHRWEDRIMGNQSRIDNHDCLICFRVPRQQIDLDMSLRSGGDYIKYFCANCARVYQHSSFYLNRHMESVYDNAFELPKPFDLDL